MQVPERKKTRAVGESRMFSEAKRPRQGKAEDAGERNYLQGAVLYTRAAARGIAETTYG